MRNVKLSVQVTAHKQEIKGLISNSSSNHQQENNKWHMHYYIMCVCGIKPAEVTIHGSSLDKGFKRKVTFTGRPPPTPEWRCPL